jgi:polyisoprenoid-binding protein YceI
MKNKITVSFVAAVMLLFASALIAADTYVVDKGHSLVGFKATHLLISKVSGRFLEFSGTINYDENDITKSSITGAIKTASINTENSSRDQDLRSANWFEVEKYPEITFQSKKVQKRGDDLLVTGILTMHGVSKEIVLNVKLTGPIENRGQKRIGIEARTTMDRRDFGLRWDNRLDSGGLVVSNDIEIELAAEAIKQ